MNRTIAWLLLAALAIPIGCSPEDITVGRRDPNDPAAAARAAEAELANQALITAKGNPVKACRLLAEQGAWSHALDVCEKAHEALPEDLSLEHAYQQAKAASLN